VSAKKEELIRFWKSFASDPDLRTFKAVFNIARWGIFHNFFSYFWKADWIFMKILSETYISTRKSPLTFGNHLDPDPDLGRGRLDGSLRSPVAHMHIHCLLL